MGARTAGRALPSLVFAVFALVAVCGSRAAEVPLPLRDAPQAARTELPDPDGAPYLGVATVDETRGLRVTRVVLGSAAEAAGLRVGDLLLRVDEERVGHVSELRQRLALAGTGGRVRITLERNNVRLERSAELGRSERPSPYFRGERFRLLVVPVAFADDDTGLPTAAELTRFYFERTGTRGAGASLADYFDAQSNARLRVEGVVAPRLRLRGGRAAYSELPMGAPPGSLYAEAAGQLASQEYGNALDGIDGIAFVHAGEPEARPSRALWPHRAMVVAGGRTLPYFVHAASSVTDGTLGEHCHEFTHLLGIADSYGVGHVTGFGDFCLMAIGHRGGGETGSRAPFSLCAVCRLRLRWCDAVRVDPRTPQRLRLAAPADGRDDVVVIPLTPRGEEYVVLETRGAHGFDGELPSNGLLVWHVGGAPTPGQGPYGGPVDLVEAHGVDTFDASLVRTSDIAFPTERACDITPETTPAVRSRRPGAFPLHLTDIERLPDGSVAFTIGVQREVAQAPPAPYDGDVAGADGFVLRVDPVTGRTVRFLSQRRAPGHTGEPEPAGAARR